MLCKKLFRTGDSSLLSCLLLPRFRVKQVQKSRPRTVKLTQKCRSEFTTSAQITLQHSLVCRVFKSLST